MEFKKSKLISIENKDMLSISDEEVDVLNSSYGYGLYKYYFHKINGVIYHTKKGKEITILNELLGQLISSYFNLPVSNSKIYIIDDKKYLLVTDNFIKENHTYGNISTLYFPDLTYYINANIRTIDKIKTINTNNNETYKINKDSLEKLKKDLIGMIVSDYIRDQKDRFENNMIFEYNKNFVKLMPLYDFECSFLYNPLELYGNLFDIRLDDKKDIKFIRNNEIFQDALEKAIKLDFNQILDKLEAKYGITLSNSEKDNYNNVIKKRQDDIKKYKLIA